MEDAVTREFDDICKTENLVIKWKSFPGLLRPDAYVESWRILLWEKAFPAFLSTRAEKPFDKKSDFSTFPGAADVVKRVTYRYDIYELRLCILFTFRFHSMSIHMILIIWQLNFIRYFKRELLPKGAITPREVPSVLRRVDSERL